MVSEQGRPPTVAATGGTYVEGVVGSYSHLNPVLAATPVDRDVARLAFTGLMRTDRSGEIVPDLAAGVDTSADGRAWTFTIRDDARWQDGQPVVADDVIYTVSLFQDPAYSGPYAEAFTQVAMERLGSRTVRFTLPGPYGPFAASTVFPLLPAHLLEGVPYSALAASDFDRHPVGTGPFMVKDASASEVLLVANEDFYRTRPERGRPYLDRIVLRSYPDPTAALIDVARGQLDGAIGFSSEDAERSRSINTLNVYSYPTDDLTALFLNVRPEHGSPLLDRAVRQAISLGIDRGKVLDAAVDGRGAVADTLVPRTSWAYPSELQPVTASPADARRILDEAGWRDANGSGIREKDGQELSFSLATSNDPQRASGARRIADDLAAIGMAVTLRTMPFDELLNTAVRPRAFDLLLVGISGSIDPDPYPFFHSSQSADPGDNFSGFSTLATDRALENARQTSDRDARKALYAQVLAVVARESPVIFLYFSHQLYAQHVAVQGLKIARIFDASQRFWDVEDWYVKTEPRR